MKQQLLPRRQSLLEARLIAENRAIDALFARIAVVLATSVVCGAVLPALAAALTRAPA